MKFPPSNPTVAVKVEFCPIQASVVPEMAIVFKLQSQGTGALKLEVAKQLSAEKEAETEQLFPFAVRFGTLKLKGELKGGLKLIDVPQAVIVKVPVDGGLLKTNVPSKL